MNEDIELECFDGTPISVEPILNMVNKKIVSLFFLLFGMCLLYLGIREIYVISTYFNSIVPITPDTETKIFIVLGAAASVSGFVGIIRDKTIDI